MVSLWKTIDFQQSLGGCGKQVVHCLCSLLPPSIRTQVLAHTPEVAYIQRGKKKEKERSIRILKEKKKIKEENMTADGGLAALKGHLDPAKPPMIGADNPTSGLPRATDMTALFLPGHGATVMFISRAHCLITV